MVGLSNQLKGGSHQPHQCSINGMEWVWINPWSTVSNCGSFHYPCDKQNGWCHYPLGINKYGFWSESALRNRTKNEQRINWSWSPLPSSRTCRDLRCKLPDRIELGPARRDWFSKNRRDPSHNRRKDSRPPESEVYALLIDPSKP